jgi:hypothetical protein
MVPPLIQWLARFRIPGVRKAHFQTLCLQYLLEPESPKCQNGFASPGILKLEPPYDNPLISSFWVLGVQKSRP